MRAKHPMAAVALLGLLAACKPAAEPAAPVEPAPVAPAEAPAPNVIAPADTTAAAAPEIAAPPAFGSLVPYRCDDGQGITVTFDRHSAMVTLPTGGTTLNRAEDASGPGVDAYLGEEMALYRSGDGVQLDIGGKSNICTPLPAGQ